MQDIAYQWAYDQDCKEEAILAKQNREEELIRNQISKEEQPSYHKFYNSRPALAKTYAHKLTVEEGTPKKDKHGFLYCKCSKCRKYFRPTNQQVRSRIRCLNGQMPGESRLYCSQECKDTCEVFNQQTRLKGITPTDKREGMQLGFHKAILKRDGYRCQCCGISGKYTTLEAHHIYPSAGYTCDTWDLDNGITYCHDCHKTVHTMAGCTNRDIEDRCLYPSDTELQSWACLLRVDIDSIFFKGNPDLLDRVELNLQRLQEGGDKTVSR